MEGGRPARHAGKMPALHINRIATKFSRTTLVNHELLEITQMADKKAPYVFIRSAAGGLTAAVAFCTDAERHPNELNWSGKKCREVDFAEREYDYIETVDGALIGYAINCGVRSLEQLVQRFGNTSGFQIKDGLACFFLRRDILDWRVVEVANYYLTLWEYDDTTLLEIADFESRWNDVQFDYSLIGSAALV